MEHKIYLVVEGDTSNLDPMVVEDIGLECYAVKSAHFSKDEALQAVRKIIDDEWDYDDNSDEWRNDTVWIAIRAFQVDFRK